MAWLFSTINSLAFVNFEHMTSMKKQLRFKFIAFAFFTCSMSLLKAQDLKKRIEGEWVCEAIVDEQGNKSEGKFGSSNEYLRFTFFGKKLTISEAPFDEGLTKNIKFDLPNFSFSVVNDFYFDLPENLPETEYRITELNDSLLILTTLNAKRKKISYRFLNQKLIASIPDLRGWNIIINHVNLSHKYGSLSSKLGLYSITNGLNNLQQVPKFRSKRAVNFGDALSNAIKLPENLPKGLVTNEIVLEFTVGIDGAKEFIIKRGHSPDFDKELLQALKKLAKNWHPVVINNSATESKMEFSLSLISSDKPFVMPFKNAN